MPATYLGLEARNYLKDSGLSNTLKANTFPEENLQKTKQLASE